jgi:hypothetical protein
MLLSNTKSLLSNTHQHAGQIGCFDRRVLSNPRRHSLASPSQPSLYLTPTSLPTTHIHYSLLNAKNDYIRPQIRQATRQEGDPPQTLQAVLGHLFQRPWSHLGDAVSLAPVQQRRSSATHD